MSEIQKMRFWGTSAGEGSPTPFCKCRVCEHARRYGGKDLRTRSCFRIDEEVMIDAGADFVPQSIKYLEDTFAIQHILYTHTHEDHYNSKVPWFRSTARDNKPEGKLHIYFSRDGINVLKKVYKGDEPFLSEELVEFHALDYYQTYQIGAHKVTPLKGCHHTDIEPNSTNYLIEFPSGKKMYYALDSGVYLEETFEYLKDIRLDLLIGEGTFPVEGRLSPVHMTLMGAKMTLDRLMEQGTIDKDTLIYLTHICPMTRTHDEIVEYWNGIDTQYQVHIAFDGLSIDEEAKMWSV